MLTDFTARITSQFICTLDNHTVCLKFTKCYMSTTAAKKRGKNSSVHQSK